MPAELFGEGAGQGRYSRAVPMRGDAGAMCGVSEEVKGSSRLIPMPRKEARPSTPLKAGYGAPAPGQPGIVILLTKTH